MRHLRLFAPSILLILACLPAVSQEVISAHSGTVHFSEGAVSIEGQPIDRKPATFPSVPKGATLSTEKGRVEVLLTPNVVLRLDENSAIRLAANSLTDTQVEFLRGSVIIDSMNAPETPPVTLLFERNHVRFLKPGIYRVDSDTSVLQTYAGQAQVTTPESKTSEVDNSKLFFFDLGALTNKFGEPNEDEFYDWARGRADSIAAENQLAQEANAPPDDDGSTPGIFTNPLPSYGVNPPYSSYPSITTYAFDPWFNPLFGYSGGAFGPYNNVFPIFVVVQPRNWQNGSHWPHPPTTPVYTPTHVGSSIFSSPVRYPVYMPRPANSIAARPATIAPRAHPSAPAVASHPIAIHR